MGGAGAAWEEIEAGTTSGDDGDLNGDEREIDVLLSGMGGDGGMGRGDGGPRGVPRGLPMV